MQICTSRQTTTAVAAISTDGCFPRNPPSWRRRCADGGHFDAGQQSKQQPLGGLAKGQFSMTMQQPPDAADFAAEPRSIDLRDYWLAVRRRWQLVLVLAALGAVLAGGYAHTLAPTYSATAQVLVNGITGGPSAPTSQVHVPVNMSTEQSVAQGTGVIDAAAQILKVQPTVLQAEAVKNLTVTVPATTLTTSNVLQITWKAGSPRAAQAGADAFATAFLAGWHQGLDAQIASLRATLSRNVAELGKQIGHVSTQLSNAEIG